MVSIRDQLWEPMWDTIRLDPVAVRIMDSVAFQRLRYIRQLGLAYLVYPGATHTRFDHALGVYHLATRALAILDEEGFLTRVDPLDRRLIPLAALLHDVGHYPFSHAIEELEEGLISGHHEAVVGRFLEDDEVESALSGIAPDAAARVEALIRGNSSSPLQGLVSGSLDLDKIEYLKRDARFCGVPYGEVDVDRLLHALVVLRDPEGARLEVGVREKGVAALESLLFATYQMFRNVYWHHAVRAATVMYKRIVADAILAGILEPEELIGRTDESLLFLLESRAPGTKIERWVGALRSRRLPKRLLEIVAADLDGEGVGEWMVFDSPLKREVEDRLASELGLEPGAIFLDYPAKPLMFDLDLLALRGDGEVIRLGPRGESGLIGLPRIADELYRSARVLRLFAFGEGLGESRAVRSALIGRIDPDALRSLAILSPSEISARLRSDSTLL